MNSIKKMKSVAGERFQYLVRDYNDVTVRFVLEYGVTADAEVLRTAVKTVLYSVDVLHGTLLEDKGKLTWQIFEQIPEEQYFRHIRTEKNLRRAAAEQALIPVKPEEPVKMRCTLVENGRESALVLCVSHTVADGGDARYLLKKIVEAYNRILCTGSARGLAIKNGNRAPEQLYRHMSRQEQRKMWRNPLTGTKNQFPFQDQQPGTGRMILADIPREQMDRARVRARQNGMTANDVILAACYQAYAALPGVDPKAPVSITSMMDLRRHCPGGDSEGLSNMTGSLKTVMWDGVTGNYAQTLAEIGRQTREAKEDPLAGLAGVPMIHHAVGHAPLGLLLKIVPKVYRDMSVGVTNMGNLKGQDYMLGDAVPFRGLMGGPSKKKPGMQVSVLSVDGACTLCVVGEYTDSDEIQMKAMLENVVRVIRDYGEE